jgi:hypothetical protein
MRSRLVITAAVLWLATLAGPVLADKPAPPKSGGCSGDYGTNVYFEESPQAAAKQALKDEKLVMVLHISGHFDDPALT